MMNTTATAIGTQAAATTTPAASSKPSKVEVKPIPVAGSGAYLEEALGVASATSATAGKPVVLDAFAKRGGPDVAVKTDAGIVAVHAVFQMDPTTNEMQVSIVDDAGRLIRMIPPDSVARMIAAMATYRGR
jgi:hypothetical protein